MATYASLADVSVLFPLSASREAEAQRLLDDAEGIIRTRVPYLDAHIATGRVTSAAVRSVLVGMVIEVLRNPSGYRSEQAGDYTYTFDRSSAAGALRLSAEDIKVLTGRTGRPGSVQLADDARHRPLRTPPLVDGWRR